MHIKFVLLFALLFSCQFIFAQENTSDTIAYADVEVKPIFPGGDAALLKYIAENTKYPEIAIEQNIQGRVFVKCIINEDGKVTNPEIMRGVNPYYDAEALRLVSTIPEWLPGKQNGKTVCVIYVIPVNFKLN